VEVGVLLNGTSWLGVCLLEAVMARSESWKRGACGMKNLRLAISIVLQLALCLFVAGVFNGRLARPKQPMGPLPDCHGLLRERPSPMPR